MSQLSSSRKDASRNREALIATASRVFASEVEPSMRLIAREGGVGIGTLYRHFPTRELLVEAIYKEQLDRLVNGAQKFLREEPPAKAMRSWMCLTSEWVATKRGMTQTLSAMFASGEIGFAESRETLLSTVETLLAAGRAAGDIRSDVSAEDVATSLLGIFMAAGAPEQSDQANRLLDLLMDGLKVR